MPTTPSGAEPLPSEPADATTPRETAARETMAGEISAGATSEGATACPTPMPAGAAAQGLPGSAQRQDPVAVAESISTEALIEQLQADRLWLLRQIDAGAYPELRLDLAALERELGQLLEQAGERIAGS